MAKTIKEATLNLFQGKATVLQKLENYEKTRVKLTNT